MTTLAHISDVHFGKNTAERVGALLADLARVAPSVIVVSGDLTQRARVGQFEQAAMFLKRLPAPYLVVPGNHDVPLWNCFRRFANPLGRYRRIISADVMPVFSNDELRVIGLSSARAFSLTWNGFWKDGWLTDSQLSRAQSLLQGAPAGATKVVVTHHPFIPPPGHRNEIILRADRAQRVFEECGVKLLLAGHLHRSYSGPCGSMTSIQAGTACSTRYRGEGNAYNLITVEANRVTVEVRVLCDGRFVTRPR